MFYKKFTTHSSCKNLICNLKTHFKSDDNTKNSVEMDFFNAFFGPRSMHLGANLLRCTKNLS
jgi:hypothetical protein